MTTIETFLPEDECEQLLIETFDRLKARKHIVLGLRGAWDTFHAFNAKTDGEFARRMGRSFYRSAILSELLKQDNQQRKYRLLLSPGGIGFTGGPDAFDFADTAVHFR